MTDIENPIRLKMDLQEAALVLQSMRHPILSKAVLQAIKLIEALSGEALAAEPHSSLHTVPVTEYPDWEGTAYRDGRVLHVESSSGIPCRTTTRLKEILEAYEAHRKSSGNRVIMGDLPEDKP